MNSKNDFEWWKNGRERWNSYTELVSASDTEDDKSLPIFWNCSDLLLSTKGDNNLWLNQDYLWLSKESTFNQQPPKSPNNLQIFLFIN